jgi:hypothetical protein
MGRQNLVLGADSLFKSFLFYFNPLQRKLPLTGHETLQSVQCVKQSYRKRRTRPHTAPSRKISVMVNFQASIDL